MAEPAFVNLALDGQEKTFQNSGDMRLILTGYAPAITQEAAAGEANPFGGTISLTGSVPTVGQPDAVKPATGSAALRGHYDKWGVGLVLQGQAPTIQKVNTSKAPPTGAIAITGQTPARITGLKLDGQAPSLAFSFTIFPASGSLAFGGDDAEIIVTSPNNIQKLPTKAAVTLTGQPAFLQQATESPTTGTATLTGAAPTLLIGVSFVSPSAGSLAIVGKQPRLGSFTGPTVIIGPGANEGTVIRNTNATTDVPVNYVICDRTGFKQKVKYPLAKDWTGSYVRQDSWDNRMDQNAELVRGRKERYKKGPLRPEPVGSERFIEDEYPDGVDASTDLDP